MIEPVETFPPKSPKYTDDLAGDCIGSKVLLNGHADK